MRIPTVLLLAVLALPAGVLAAPWSAPTPETHVVTMTGFPGFGPAVLQVPAGHAVIWRNVDQFTHTATALVGAVPDSGPVAPGGSYTASFPAPGLVVYRCLIHPTMVGVVRVL